MTRPINRLVSSVPSSYYSTRYIDGPLVLVKFLKDFVVGQDSVVIETYYPPSAAGDMRATNLPVSGFSTQWEGSITFLGILEVGCIYHRVDEYASYKPSL